MGDGSHPVASDDQLMLARAFDRAWDEFLAIEGASANIAEYRGALAARIIVVAKAGDQSETAISAVALTYLRALLAARRLAGESQQAAGTAGAIPGAVLDQDAIVAASAAYDGCLDELPDGISATARSALLQTILANAGKGVRDSERLRLLALEALKSRR